MTTSKEVTIADAIVKLGMVSRGVEAAFRDRLLTRQNKQVHRDAPAIMQILEEGYNRASLKLAVREVVAGVEGSKATSDTDQPQRRRRNRRNKKEEDEKPASDTKNDKPETTKGRGNAKGRGSE